MRHLIAATLLAMVAAPLPAGPVPPRDAPARHAGYDLVRAARDFMAAYAGELAAGDRAALPARYSREGAHLVGLGPARFLSRDALAARYAGPGWRPPASFAWRDLTYEAVGVDAVLVVGGFDWGPASGGPARPYAYSALLRREDGALRIRIEHENLLPPPPAAPN